MRLARVLSSVSLAGFILSVGLAPLCAQEQPDPEMMKKWQEAMTPGENHKHLKWKEGKWDLTVKMWMTPNAPPTESPAKSEMKMLLDGRYLADHTEGTFQEMPFKGMGITGYDNIQKKFVTVWIDNFGTGFMQGEGQFDETKKEFRFKSTSPDPMTGKIKNFRSVEKIINEDSFVMSMYTDGPDGTEFKNMEITYKRVK